MRSRRRGDLRRRRVRLGHRLLSDDRNRVGRGILVRDASRRHIRVRCRRYRRFRRRHAATLPQDGGASGIEPRHCLPSTRRCTPATALSADYSAAPNAEQPSRNRAPRCGDKRHAQRQGTGADRPDHVLIGTFWPRLLHLAPGIVRPQHQPVKEPSSTGPPPLPCGKRR